MTDCNVKVENDIKSDINKIIKAKNVLYDRILSKLENEIKSNSKQKGGSMLNINGEIKILGTMEIPSINHSDRVLNKLDQASLPNQMSIEQATADSFKRINSIMI